jgi:fatty-acyl-CoA synthase
LLTHGNIVSSGLVQADEFCPPTGLQPGMNIIHGAPVNHVSGATEWGATPLIAGCTQICNDYFDPILALQQSEKFKVPLIAGVPAMWAMIFGAPNFDKYDLSSVRFGMIGGSMAPYPILEKMKQLTPNCCNPCGMSEVTGLSTYSDIGASVENLHLTVGKCAPEFQMRVVDSNRKPVPDGTPGEIAYRGPSRMKEYWRMPEATAAAIDEEGWLYSGDAGVIDENGDLRIIGRLKEMFITGGFNVYPVEIEDQISKYPGVAMAAVVGIPHELMGEVGRAYIVPKPGVTLDGDEIQKYLKEYLADYKIPRNYVFREALPMTLLGKIEKKVLRQEVEKEFAI